MHLYVYVFEGGGERSHLLALCIKYLAATMPLSLVILPKLASLKEYG